MQWVSENRTSLDFRYSGVRFSNDYSPNRWSCHKASSARRRQRRVVSEVFSLMTSQCRSPSRRQRQIYLGTLPLCPRQVVRLPQRLVTRFCLRKNILGPGLTRKSSRRKKSGLGSTLHWRAHIWKMKEYQVLKLLKWFYYLQWGLNYWTCSYL